MGVPNSTFALAALAYVKKSNSASDSTLLLASGPNSSLVMSWPSFPCPSVTKAEYISSNVQSLRMASISPLASKITCARADTHTCGCAAAFCARPATKTAARISLEHKHLCMQSPSAAHFAMQLAARDPSLDEPGEFMTAQVWPKKGGDGTSAGKHDR